MGENYLKKNNNEMKESVKMTCTDECTVLKILQWCKVCMNYHTDNEATVIYY